MFAWLPIIGPIIQGIVSIFTKKMDTDVQKLTVTRQNDTEEAKVSAQIIHDTKDDLGIKISRDIIIFPTAVWFGLGAYDTIIAHHYPQYMFIVEKFPEQLSMMPYAVLVFLLGNIGINAWSRR